MTMRSRSESPHPQHHHRSHATPPTTMAASSPPLLPASISPFIPQPLPGSASLSIASLLQPIDYGSAPFDLSSLSNSLIPHVQTREHPQHSQLNDFANLGANLAFRQPALGPSVGSNASQAEEQQRMGLAGISSSKKKDVQAVQPRQIRFVQNDGRPHAKRRRINAA